MRFRLKTVFQQNALSFPTPSSWSAAPAARRRLYHHILYSIIRCLFNCICCCGGSLVDNNRTPSGCFRPVRSDRLHRRRAQTASHRNRIRTRVVGVFVMDMQRFDSRADAQTPDVADQEIYVIAFHGPLVTLETSSYHQRYPGLSTALHGPAVIMCITAIL